MIVADSAFTILDDLETYHGATDGAERASIMRSLISRLQKEPFFNNIYCDVILSCNYALLLGYPDSFQYVHIHWIEDETYQVWLDHCGTSTSTFYGNFTKVQSSGVVSMLREYIEGVERGRPPLELK